MKSIKALSELAQWFLQSELENVNFPPRRKTNQSTTNTNGQQVNGDVGDGHGILPVPTSSMELLTSDIMSHLQNEKEEASSCVHHFVVVGQVGFGKSTLLSNVLNQAVFNKSLIAPEQVVRISLKPHSSIFSLYSFFSKLAQNFNLRKDAAALEALEGRQERKDLAVLKVLKRFQLLCIDDIDADGFKILKHLNKILDAYDQKLIIVSTCLNIKDFQSHSNGKDVHTFLIRPLSNQDSMKMFESLLDLGIDVSIPETYIHLAKGIPSNICVISGILNYYQDVAYFTQLTAEGEMHAPLLCTLNKELDCLSKYLLDQLCQMKRPIPVHDPTVFEKLLKFGLVNNELRGGYVFVSATSSMQKLYPEVVKCQSHNIDNITQFSATELWKDLLSPKLREILVACQTRGDTFVPESWNSVKDVSSEDRYNVNDLINKTNEYDQSLKEYDIILECLYHALLEEDYSHCVALIFLIDRYTFWTGTCKAALAVLKFIEERSPQTPIPPQVVIRKARVLKNDGDIQEAVRLLDQVINNEESIGSYKYKSQEDARHVVALCVSIKGDILRGLSLWKEAAKTLIHSIDLTNSLERIEKKIISGSKAHLADTFRYMSLNDYQELAKQYNLVTGYPLREAIRYATEAAQLCTFTPLFYLKNKRRAGDLSLIISKMLRDDHMKFQYLENAAHEFKEGLRCHDSISRLESKDQFYEFILAVHRLSLICREEVVTRRIGENIGLTLDRLAKLLYEHHCMFPQLIKHTHYSKILIDLSLSLVGLPAIPVDDNLQMIDSYVPFVEVKPSANVQSLTALRDERVQEISNIINTSQEDRYPSKGNEVGSKARTGMEDDLKEDKKRAFIIRDGTTVSDSQSFEDDDRQNEKDILRAMQTCDTTGSTDDETLTNIKCRTTVQTQEEDYGSVLPSFDRAHKEASIRSLKTASTTVDLCYATAEDESADERNIKVKTTISTLETSDKSRVDWETVEKLHTGVKLPSEVHRALQWLYDAMNQSWTASETLAYIGEKLELGKKAGACRDAFNFEFLEQDDPLRKYVGKQYKLKKYKDRPRLMQQYRQDIVCQSLSRYYATLFNTALYQCPEGKSIGQVQFLPAVLIEILDISNEAEKYYNVEPYIAGEFVKISNNFDWIVQGDVPGKDLLMAFSHFSFCSSAGKLIIVDIQGWTSKERAGQTFLTDPQIHTMDKKGFGTANRGKEGFRKFWTEQHSSCSSICKMLGLNSERPAAELFL